jgi:hypothetical protein
MHSPYTFNSFDAFMAAQTSVGLGLTAIAWSRPSRPPVSTFLLLGAIWWVVLLPLQHDLLESLGTHVSPDNYIWSLKTLAALGTVAALLSGRVGTFLFALAGEAVLYKLSDYIVESDHELAALHLAYLGVLVGLQARAGDGDVTAERPTRERSFLAHDVAMFALATALAIAVSVFVLDQWIDSSDEWAYTFQAAVFAKGRAFAPAPPCADAYQNFWVFEHLGREFAQYTPGWPLFMAPFQLIGIPQFAASASLGLLVVAVARLARRAARESGYVERGVAAAGTAAALCTTFSSTLLINGGSRFGHVFSAALLAWGVESICAAEDASRTGWRRGQLGWSIALGVCAAWLPATRPGDGTVSAIGLGLYGMYALTRRRLSLRAVLGTTAAAAAVGALTLVILRLQLGVWFKTGYSLTTSFYPWVDLGFARPKASEWKWGIPLATGAYCWWPLSPALGMAGLVSLRGPAKRIGFMLALGALAVLALSSGLQMGRGFDWGYGPRYVLPVLVPMSVGTGVVLAPLAVRSHASAPGTVALAGGPWTLAVTAVMIGVVRLIPLVYPPNYESIRATANLRRDIRRYELHNAVVLLPTGVGWMNEGLDMTTNLPLKLYPDQDVIVAMDRNQALTQCVKNNYRGRVFYTALPGDPVKFTRN